jgi:folate-binding protein YgfZ
VSAATEPLTAFAVPIRRDVVVVEGPDAAAYLQGQLAQDMPGMEIGGWAWSLLLQPQGKIEAWVRVHRVSELRYELDVEESFGAAVMARLRRFLIRTDATIAETSRDMCAVRGRPIGGASGRAVDLAPICWPGVEGFDAIGHGPEGVDAGTIDDLEALRVSAGVPAMGSELTSDVIPAEVGSWFIDASVSFTKGCYVGQELVARVDSRGNRTPRKLRVIALADGATDALRGAELCEPDGRVVGALTSVAGGRALAYVHRSVEVPTALVVRVGDVEQPATVLADDVMPPEDAP